MIYTSSFAIEDGRKGKRTTSSVIVFFAGTCRLFGGHIKMKTEKEARMEKEGGGGVGGDGCSLN